MRKLLCFLKGYEKESVLGPLFKLFEATLELFVPLAVASLIDTGIANKDFDYILKMFFVLVALGIIGLAFSLTAQFFAAKAAVGFVKKLKHALFQHMEQLSYTEIDRLGTSAMVNRMTSDMNQIQSGMNMSLRLLLRSPFVVAGAFIMAWIIDDRAAKIFGITILVLTVIVYGIMIITIPLYRKVQQKLDMVSATTRENLVGVRVIRAFGLEEEEKKEFVQKHKSLTQGQKFVGSISALTNPLTYVAVNIGIAVLIWQGAIQVEYGILTQGAVVALYNYMAQILEELVKLANMIVLLTKMVASGNRVQSVLEMKSSQIYPEKTNKEKQKKMPFVVFENVSLKYHGAGEESLTNINFQVNQGQVVGVIGGTGCGKTSLVNLIPRFYDATEGTVWIDGIDVKEYQKKEIRNMVGVVPQKAVLFKGSIRDNLCWGKTSASEEEIWKALEIAQAKEIVEQKAEKLDFEISQNGRNLSGGQRQRMTIARALVKRPRILILDDSASALDYTTDANLRKALQNMEEKPTIFIVSQRTISIQHADIILVLDDGDLVGMGTHQELLESCETYQEIYASQFKKEVSNS
ncbi:MAG: ABC transporter ATP-binding protein [Lachnospiraceae bacterium]|nr:ABC transporter ATP-binding protein [Lachnospiraceae bacterium]